MTLHWETLLSLVPPSNFLSLYRTLEGLFWSDRTPFKGPRHTSWVASRTKEIQGHCQVCRARWRGPRTSSMSRTIDTNLDCAFVKSPLVFHVPKIGGALEPHDPTFMSPLTPPLWAPWFKMGVLPSTSDVRRVTLAAFRRPAGRANPIRSNLSRRNFPPFFDLALKKKIEKS